MWQFRSLPCVMPLGLSMPCAMHGRTNDLGVAECVHTVARPPAATKSPTVTKPSLPACSVMSLYLCGSRAQKPYES